MEGCSSNSENSDVRHATKQGIIKAIALIAGIVPIAWIAGYMAGEFANASNVIPTVISALVAVLLGWCIVSTIALDPPSYQSSVRLFSA